MKRLFTIITAAMLALSISTCGGKLTMQQTADQFAEEIFIAIKDNFDSDQIEKIGEKMGLYINDLTEEQKKEFYTEFANKIYKYSDKYGYGEAFADEFLQSLFEATIRGTAEQFVEEIFIAIKENSGDDRLEEIGNKMGLYINDLTEEQGEVFGEEFAEKLYEYSDKYGYGEAFADEFLQSMAKEMIQPTDDEN